MLARRSPEHPSILAAELGGRTITHRVTGRSSVCVLGNHVALCLLQTDMLLIYPPYAEYLLRVFKELKLDKALERMIVLSCSHILEKGASADLDESQSHQRRGLLERASHMAQTHGAVVRGSLRVP